MAKALESPVQQIAFSPSSAINAVITDDRSGKKNPRTTDIPIPLMNVQQTYVIPANSRGFSMKLLLGKLSLKFDPGDDFREIAAGSSYELEKISPDAGTITLYFKSSKDNDTLQVESWS
jgi:hypothetical protein